MSDKPKRVALGFHAGGALSLRMDQEKLDELRSLLQGRPSGFADIEAVDGTVLVNLAQVIYLRVESDEQRIGF